VIRQAVVSIHAPVWGATCDHYNGGCTRPVSIHAPVWGATSGMRKGELCGRFNPRARMGRDTNTKSGISWTGCFNPRARMGRDDKLVEVVRAHGVSIHAPVWGATQYQEWYIVDRVFQSTRPYGARPEAASC